MNIAERLKAAGIDTKFIDSDVHALLDKLAELEARTTHTRRQAMADMKERCAKVAESYEPECESCPRGVTAAIRALPLEET